MTSEQCSCSCRCVLLLLLLENAMFGGKIHSSMRYGCKMYCILTYYCLLLATATLSRVTYKTVHSTECGQGGPLQDEQLMVALKQVHEQLGPPGCNPPRNRSCHEIHYCFPSASSGYHKTLTLTLTLTAATEAL